ncbi:Uncharacterized protein TCM_038526 [Theobroma cacao]|uniref:RNase H type-1 domain-containing protein n=1 Tax=Theobroma cacao TaxID=3641 RepID=A0A061GWU7_THECC|nr:Uncharacterized protein TCM_038526 [Theobroma cacao]
MKFLRTELLAIKEAFTLFVASKWVTSHGFMVESDLANAILWVNYPDKAHWRMVNILNLIGILKRKVVRSSGKGGVMRAAELLVVHN